MTLPTTDTVVTYPGGDTVSSGIVLHVEALPGGRSAVILDRTAAHPVDTAWPDQPADHAVLHTDEGDRSTVDVVVGAIDDGQLYLGPDVPVRTGTEGWVFVVAHVVEGPPPEIGAAVRVEVDEDYRRALSAGHTACHLASLALDAAVADRWTKPAPVDALGNPAFDALAIQSSRIGDRRSEDVYRLGKSLRRKGLPASAFDDLDGITGRVNSQLAAWIAAGGRVRIDAPGPGLSDRRCWQCRLPDGEASIPCGGTHVVDIAALGHVTVALSAVDTGSATEITMHTTVSGNSA